MKKYARIVMIPTMIFCSAALAADDRPLLKNYRGKEQVPEDLYQTYANLINAMRAGQEDQLRQFCLPHSVTITREARPAHRQEYGHDMNLPFLKSRFSGAIRLVTKEPDGCYQLSTDTSYLFFVETKTSGWKLYRYGDAPIK